MKIVLQISTGKILQTYSGIEPDDETQLNGTTTWKDAIAKVKADNPKEAE